MCTTNTFSQGEKEILFEVLHVLEFTSFRKRMGVVVRDPSGRIFVMVKGAVSLKSVSGVLLLFPILMKHRIMNYSFLVHRRAPYLLE